MKIIGIIPARYGSSRFPGKPLALILGKTLIQRTYENAKLIPELEHLIVATDDQKIFDHVKGFGGEAVMTSSNCLTGSDRLAEVIRDNESLATAEIILNIQGDEPCLDPQIISKLIVALKNDPLAVLATPISKIDDAKILQGPSVKCVTDLQGNALYFSRALIPSGLKQEIQPQVTYYKHVGIYAYRKDFLLIYSNLPSTPLQLAEDLEQLKILENGYRIKTVVVDYFAHEVNYPSDIQKIEHYLCQQNICS